MNLQELMDAYHEEGLTRELAASRVCQDIVLKAISHIDIDVSADFMKQFVIGSFINTVKWWIGNGLTQSPGEIIDSYLKCLIRQHKNG